LWDLDRWKLEITASAEDAAQTLTVEVDMICSFLRRHGDVPIRDSSNYRQGLLEGRGPKKIMFSN